MKKAFIVRVVSVLGLIAGASADQQINDTQQWPSLNISGETLTIGPSGNLTVDAPGVGNNLIGGRIVINGGTLIINGPGDESRLNMDQNAAITVNSGLAEIDVDDGIKFPDNAGPVRITLNGGTLRVSYIELVAERDPLITIGGGILLANRIYLDDPIKRDPQNWLAAGVLVPATGYDQIVINPDNGQGFVEVSATGGQPPACPCPGDLNEDEQIDLEDLQALAGILLDAGSPFVVEAEPGHCADLNADEQIDLEDLQQVAALLLQAGSPFVVQCE